MKQQYDSYKPSGIDWIGDIPSHWDVLPLKRISAMFGRIGYRGYTVQDLRAEGEGAITLSPSNMSNGSMDYENVSYLSWEKYHESPEIKIQEGDILFVKTGSTFGKTSYVDELPMEATINPQILRIVPSIHKKYLAYCLGTPYSQALTDCYVVGSTIPTISQESIGKFVFCVPPLPEQEAIAAWLDEKCGEIDAAIAKVDREIELIDELKHSEISRVVTRGLNPDTPLRPSGIDWIGDVPEHWFNTRIKFNILRSAAGVWGDDEKGDENDIVCFRIADFDYDERCLSTEKITIRNIESKQLEGRYLSKGDLLIEKSGGGESTPVGRVVYCNYNGKATYTNFIHSITLSDSVDSRFFLYYFNMLYSNKVNLLFFNQTTGLQNLQVSDYLGQSICLPPLSEQQAIADYLDKKCVEIDGLKAKLSKKRETLTELRQSIISEVVTGKRKVI